MRVRNPRLPSIQDHYKAMQQAGSGLHVYHSAQYGNGFLSNAWQWFKPILASTAKSAAQSAVAAGLKASKDGNWKDIAKQAGMAGLNAAKVSGQRNIQQQLAAGNRPF